jgi:hypothetical protein
MSASSWAFLRLASVSATAPGAACLETGDIPPSTVFEPTEDPIEPRLERNPRSRKWQG